MMTQQEVDRVVKLSKKLVVLIRRDTTSFTRQQLEALANEILYWEVEFVAYKIKAEQAFSARIRDIMAEKETSYTAAENEARTEQVYYTHKQTKYINEIAEERIKVLKLMIGSAY